MIPEIASAQFEDEVSNSAVPVLVDFFTPWCGPCRNMLPVVEEISRERTGTLKVVKFDAAKDPAFATGLRVSSVPNFVLFKSGVPLAQRVGVATKDDLLGWIDGNLG
jgi:thioredoxin